MKLYEKKYIGLFLMAASVLLLMAPVKAMSDDVYRFSMMPQYYPERIRAMTDPLVQSLARECGRSISVIMAKNNSEYEKSIHSGEVDMGYQNPVIYTNVDREHEVIAVGVSHEGGEKYRGLIIVPSASPVTRLFELKGRSAMTPGKNTVGGYFSPRATLLEAGVNPEKDMELVIAADNKQENVIIATSLGDVDAGFIRESAFHTADVYIKPGSVRILAPCAWMPGWAFSVKRSLPESEKLKIKKYLTALSPGSSVLSAIGLKSFMPADDRLYDSFRKIYHDAEKSDAVVKQDNTAEINR